ncbi:MAG: helix-turn-helix domain-containing protein [Rhodospirillaceae bacterium]|nr:helix-turn-helix domain-containing protein [Rhodospirillaceae bacterium]
MFLDSTWTSHAGMSTNIYPNRLRELRLARGYSQKELAERVSPRTTQPTIDRLEKGERSLDTGWLEMLAAALEVTPADLLRDTDRSESTLSYAPKSLLPGLAGAKDLPILGYVKAGAEGFFIVNGEVQGYAVRPDLLQGVKDAYAVYVHDKSMFPAFEPGHLAWVDPLRPVRPGDSVIVQLMDGQAFIKRLKRRTERAVICEQWNPVLEIKYDTKKIRAIHLVVGSMRVAN